MDTQNQIRSSSEVDNTPPPLHHSNTHQHKYKQNNNQHINPEVISDELEEQDPEIESKYECNTQHQKLKVPYIEKNNGNVYFKKQQYSKALKHYSMSLMAFNVCKGDRLFQLTNQPELLEQYSKDIEIGVNLNMALAYLKIHNFQNAIHHAKKVVEVDGNNVKAHYRMGMAYLSIGDHDHSGKHLKIAYQHEPNNNEIIEGLNKLKANIQSYKLKSKKIAQTIFPIKPNFQKSIQQASSKKSKLENQNSKPKYAGPSLKRIMWVYGLGILFLIVLMICLTIIPTKTLFSKYVSMNEL